MENEQGTCEEHRFYATHSVILHFLKPTNKAQFEKHQGSLRDSVLDRASLPYAHNVPISYKHMTIPKRFNHQHHTKHHQNSRTTHPSNQHPSSLASSHVMNLSHSVRFSVGDMHPNFIRFFMDVDSVVFLSVCVCVCLFCDLLCEGPSLVVELFSAAICLHRLS